MKQGYTVFHFANRDSLYSSYNICIVTNYKKHNEVALSYCTYVDEKTHLLQFTVAIFRLKLKEQCKN